MQSRALPKFDDLHLFTGFRAPFRYTGRPRMLSGAVELIPDGPLVDSQRLTVEQDVSVAEAAIAALGPESSEVSRQRREGIPT